jgi:hypothetical protein
MLLRPVEARTSGNCPSSAESNWKRLLRSFQDTYLRPLEQLHAAAQRMSRWRPRHGAVHIPREGNAPLLLHP